MYAGRIRYIEKYYTSHIHPNGERRTGKRGETTASQKKANQRRRIINLWGLIEENFKQGDYHAVLHFQRNNQPQNATEAEKIFAYALRIARRLCKAAGKEFRWIAVIENTGKSGRNYHFHVIVNKQAFEHLGEAWERATSKHGGAGKVSCDRLDGRDTHRALAVYLLKHSDKMAKEWAETGHTKKERYRTSNNLNKPQITKEIIRTSNRFSRTPKPHNGYKIVPLPSGELVEGDTTPTGWEWQAYTEVIHTKGMTG